MTDRRQDRELIWWVLAGIVWIAIAGWLLSACVPVPPPAAHPILVTVRDSQTQQVILTATGTLTPTGGPGTPCEMAGARLQCLTTAGGAGSLRASAEWYQDATLAILSLSVPEQGKS
jgi:multidrug efflux pump subunit AcrA (membrane-fusion protein)